MALTHYEALKTELTFLLSRAQRKPTAPSHQCYVKMEVNPRKHNSGPDFIRYIQVSGKLATSSDTWRVYNIRFIPPVSFLRLPDSLRLPADPSEGRNWGYFQGHELIPLNGEDAAPRPRGRHYAQEDATKVLNDLMGLLKEDATILEMDARNQVERPTVEQRLGGGASGTGAGVVAGPPVAPKSARAKPKSAPEPGKPRKRKVGVLPD